MAAEEEDAHEALQRMVSMRVHDTAQKVYATLTATLIATASYDLARWIEEGPDFPGATIGACTLLFISLCKIETLTDSLRDRILSFARRRPEAMAMLLVEEWEHTDDPRMHAALEHFARCCTQGTFCPETSCEEEDDSQER